MVIPFGLFLGKDRDILDSGQRFWPACLHMFFTWPCIIQATPLMESKIKNQQRQSFLPLFPFSLFTIYRKVKSLLIIHHMTTLKSVLVSSLSCSFLQRLLFIFQVLGEACIIFSLVSNSGVFYGYLLYVIYFNDLQCPLEILDLFFVSEGNDFIMYRELKCVKGKGLSTIKRNVSHLNYHEVRMAGIYWLLNGSWFSFRSHSHHLRTVFLWEIAILSTITLVPGRKRRNLR